MLEKQEEGKSKNLSETDVKNAQDFIREIGQVVQWDWGGFCTTTEELNMVRAAKEAIREIEILFHVPEPKFWTEFPAADIGESIASAEEYNAQSLPEEIINFSNSDLEKIRQMVKAIDEVINWDIGGRDETDLAMLHTARGALSSLKELL